MSGAFEILEPGLATTVQDLGRNGWLRVGAPPAGALDPEAHRLANALVGGGPSQAALELRYLGPTLRARSGPLRLALVGAEARMRVERADASEQIVEAWRSVTLNAGDLLRVGALKGSATATLAVAGGLDVPATLGSRATFARGGFGGLDGRPLQPGDRLRAASSPSLGGERWIAPERRPDGIPPDAAGPHQIRVVLGPQQDHFPAAEVERFFATEWRVSRNADRMGLRLEGAKLAHNPPPRGADIVSEGLATGSIQVPGAGEPILLLVDRGTAGGYPKIAVAASVDLPLLGRLAPAARLRFTPITVSAAHVALRAREAQLQAALASVEPYRAPGVVDEARLWTSGNLITAVIPTNEGEP